MSRDGGHGVIVLLRNLNHMVSVGTRWNGGRRVQGSSVVDVISVVGVGDG